LEAFVTERDKALAKIGLMRARMEQKDARIGRFALEELQQQQVLSLLDLLVQTYKYGSRRSGNAHTRRWSIRWCSIYLLY
jgi:hypothetical protein